MTFSFFSSLLFCFGLTVRSKRSSDNLFKCFCFTITLELFLDRVSNPLGYLVTSSQRQPWARTRRHSCTLSCCPSVYLCSRFEHSESKDTTTCSSFVSIGLIECNHAFVSLHFATKCEQKAEEIDISSERHFNLWIFNLIRLISSDFVSRLRRLIV